MVETNDKEEAPVAFAISGVGLDIEGISHALDLSPTHVHRVGENNMIGEPFSHDMWMLDSELSDTEPLDAHLKWFIEKLRPHYDFIKSLKSNAELSVYCGFNCDGDQCGFSLTPEALAIFTELGIPMEVTVLSDCEE
ncbi:MAG TPA: hypothetical protein DC047_18665 [Blastocatellia bacterium]|nr:hypothetical protein [Blastocatellia bacterium]